MRKPKPQYFEVKDKILELLQDGTQKQMITIRQQICDNEGHSPSTMYRVIKDLKNAGYIIKRKQHDFFVTLQLNTDPIYHADLSGMFRIGDKKEFVEEGLAWMKQYNLGLKKTTVYELFEVLDPKTLKKRIEKRSEVII